MPCNMNVLCRFPDPRDPTTLADTTDTPERTTVEGAIRPSLVHCPQDRLPVPACTENTQNREVTMFDTVDDQMLGTWMDANGRIKLGAFARHFRHEEQPIEGIFQDVGIAVGLLD